MAGYIFMGLLFFMKEQKKKADLFISDMHILLFRADSAEQHSMQEGEQRPDCSQAPQIL